LPDTAPTLISRGWSSASSRANAASNVDALTRDALQEHFPDKLTLSAKALDRALSAYWLSNWPAEQHLPTLPDSASPRHCALHAILRANGGKALGWRQIVNIAGGIAKKSPPLQSANVRKVS
jgi:hypothetical protein